MNNQMKMIDLLNLISQSRYSEIPKKLKYDGHIFTNLAGTGYYESDEDFKQYGLDEPFTLDGCLGCSFQNINDTIDIIEKWEEMENE